MLAGLNGGLTGDPGLLRRDADFDGWLGALLEVHGILAGVVAMVSQGSSLDLACSLLRVCFDHRCLVNKFKDCFIDVSFKPFIRSGKFTILNLNQ